MWKISKRNKSVTVVEFRVRNFHMVSKQRSGNRIRESAMSREHDARATTQKDSRSSPGKEESTKNIMDHDNSVLTSILEEEVACLASFASFEVWYIDSGALTHMTRVREYFSSYQEENISLAIKRSIWTSRSLWVTELKVLR